MKARERKAASTACKERKSVPGLYAISCKPTAEVWVGRALDLASIRNRLWFTLRQGRSAHRALQAAWTAHGADAFAFKELERMEDEDLSAGLRDLRLKDRLAYWQDRLGARAI
jgi:hypothetical protein